MAEINHRRFKDELYSEFARVADAVASPKRLEILDLLAQRERSVEDLAGEMKLSVANASRHLRILAQARLVEARRSGTFAHYRLASPSVYGLVRQMQAVAAERLPDVEVVVGRHLGQRAVQELKPSDLAQRLRGGRSVLLDVRPLAEFQAGHIPGARSLPIDEASKPRALRDLPRDGEIIVYCRGAYCVWADEAVEILRRRGFTAHRLSIGAPDWAALGKELEVA